MSKTDRTQRVVGFGVFELDLRSGDLRRNGAKVALQEQPLRLLELLLEYPGDLLTREEIEAQLWPGDTYGDHDHRLNNAVNKIRLALGDSAENPSFLETVPRRGYRFVAPVREVGGGASATRSHRAPRRPRVVWGVAAVVALVASLGSALWFASRMRSEPPQTRVMLAVLPFESIGNDTDDYIADGLTDEVILQLGRMSSTNLGVIARTSVTRYKATGKGVKRIGDELGVDYILEGTVRQEVDQLRITIQLVQVEQQTPLWSESYNRTRQDVFGVQRDIAQRASASLALAVLAPASGQSNPPTLNPSAHRSYLKARYFRDQGTEEGYHRAIDYFRLAVTEDPLFARSYAGLASCQCLIAGHGLEVIPPDVAMPRARELANKALGLDAGLAEAHAVLGMVRLKYEWDFLSAEESFLRAMELNPSSAQSYFWYSLYLDAMGRGEEAVLQARRARELDPIAKGAAANLGMQLVNAGRFEEASTEIANAFELDDEFWGTHWVHGNLHARQGNYAEAVTAYRDAVHLSGRNSVSLASLGSAYALAGRKPEAESVLEELREAGRDRYLSPAFIAVVHAGLGQTDAAFERLEEAFQMRSRYLVWLKVAPEYEPLRSDRRYEELVARIGLP